MRFSFLRGILLAALAANGALVALVGCSSHPTANSPAPASSVAAPPSVSAHLPVAAPSAYVGSAACAECHQAEYASQSHTRHAETLMAMTRKELGALAPPTGRIPRTGVLVVQRGGRFGMGLPARSNAIIPLDYALGSGKSGMTYVSLLGDNTIIEMAMSYFPHQREWHVTPGDEHLSMNKLGRTRPPEDARTCFSCHAVMPSTTTVVPPKRFFGVGCESCHGPGGTHITQMQAGNYGQDTMVRLEKWSAKRILDLCGQCHGSAQLVMAGASPASAVGISRFQPFGLAQSQCFKNSKGTLSCVTCHDSHTNLSTDQKAYNTVCLSCHTAATARRPPLLRTSLIKLCPVNKTGRCISCHMPSGSVFVNQANPIRMADHFIRVHRP